jgi:hypothetical protein
VNARRWLGLAALALAACATSPPPRMPDIIGGGAGGATKGIGPPIGGGVRDSVIRPVERNTPPPAGYGLYSVLLTRAADATSLRLVGELLATTVGADDAALPRENLNLIMLPVKNAADAGRAIAEARARPDAVAAAVLQSHYDYGQAALLLASLCRFERGPAVMRACGTPLPQGPLLVTTLVPLDGAVAPNQRILIVNLSGTSSEAVREVLASYRRQIQSKDFPTVPRTEGWRLAALNVALDVAQMLPGVSKALAGTR